MAKNNFLIYGSYGYTGNLIAEYACSQGMKPVLGGRSKEKLINQAERLGLEYRVFDVADLEETKAELENFIVVLNCAGPFSKTYKNMVQACLATHTHYIDITGEISVFEKLIEMNQSAQDAGIMLLPGAGFDIVPTDCLAQHLKSVLPDADRLVLCINAMQGPSGIGLKVSRGTAKTMAEGFAEGSMIREKSILKKIPSGSRSRTFDFGDQKPLTAVSTPWADLITAWWSTGIPNIEIYLSVPYKTILLFKLLNPVKSILNWNPVKQFIQNRIAKMPEGPTAEERKVSAARVYGEVMNESGNKAAAMLKCPDGYEFTALSSITIVKKVLAGNAPSGFQTPATAYTKNLVLEIPGAVLKDL